MRLSPTLSIYIAKQFLISFMAIFFGFVALIYLLDVIELLRRAGSKPDVTFLIVLQMGLLKLPHMAQQTFPFASLFGGMSTFWRLTRSNELAVTRAAGISAWQFLLPVLALTFALGVFKVAALNPLASSLLARYDLAEGRYLKGQKSFLALSPSGLWLRQSSPDGQAVVHARRMHQKKKTIELDGVTVFLFKGKDIFKQRIDADRALLEKGYWLMSNAIIQSPEGTSLTKPTYRLATDLSVSRIQDNFAPPETMSFWALPDFIETLEKSGFSAVRHRLHWHSQLASPFLMCAMILIAATFTLRHSRKSGASFVIASGILTGFVLYFFSDVVLALGISNSLPVVLAAWTPSGVSMLLGLAMLLHLEDG